MDIFRFAERVNCGNDVVDIGYYPGGSFTNPCVDTAAGQDYAPSGVGRTVSMKMNEQQFLRAFTRVVAPLSRRDMAFAVAGGCAVYARGGPVTTHDLMIDKLLVLDPHRCDFSPLLPIARAIRAQVDWAEVRHSAQASSCATASLQLADQLQNDPVDAQSDDFTRTDEIPCNSDQFDEAKSGRRLVENPRTFELRVTVDFGGAIPTLDGKVGCGVPVRNVAQPVIQTAYAIYMLNEQAPSTTEGAPPSSCSMDLVP